MSVIFSAAVAAAAFQAEVSLSCTCYTHFFSPGRVSSYLQRKEISRLCDYKYKIKISKGYLLLF